MSGRRAPVVQEYGRLPSGRRSAIHTPRLHSRCICGSCNKRRAWTPERRRAWGERLRQQYASGTRQVGRDGNPKHAAYWHPEQDAALRELAGQYDTLTIAAMLTARFGVPRSEVAIEHRCTTLGILRMTLRPLSSSEVGRIFGGISRETVRNRFVNSGLMPGTLRRGGPHGIRMFSRAELETLIREHPEAYDVDTIRDAGLRALALAVTRGRRLLSTPEVTRLTGVAQKTLVGWYAKGLVPSARKVRAVLPGAGGAWVIEAGDLGTVRRLRDGRASAARERAEPRRDPLTGSYLGAGETPSPLLRCRIRVVDRAEAVGRLASHG